MIILIIQIVLIMFKLFGVCTWSWWGVFTPLWLEILFIVMSCLSEWIKDSIDDCDYYGNNKRRW
jgi:hypothetical protein